MRFLPTLNRLALTVGLLSAGALLAVPAYAETTSEAARLAQMNEPMADPAAEPTMTDPAADPMMNDPAAEPTMTDPAAAPGTTPAPAQSTSQMTIVDIASGNESFNTLTQAVQAAGLTNTLSGEGPYTVFAPTDEAFSQLPDGALEFLLQPENQDLLERVLTYHVVPGEVTSSEITSGRVESLSGGLAVNVSDDGVVVNNASVVTPDIQASNGVVHVVNRVLLPDTLQRELASRLGISDIY